MHSVLFLFLCIFVPICMRLWVSKGCGRTPSSPLCFIMPHSLWGSLFPIGVILWGIRRGCPGRKPVILLYSLSTGSQECNVLWGFVLSGGKDMMLVFMPALWVHLHAEPPILPWCLPSFSKKKNQFISSICFTIFVKYISVVIYLHCYKYHSLNSLLYENTYKKVCSIYLVKQTK